MALLNMAESMLLQIFYHAFDENEAHSQAHSTQRERMLAWRSASLRRCAQMDASLLNSAGPKGTLARLNPVPAASYSTFSFDKW